MAKVTNLKIEILEDGTNDTLYASWSFKEPSSGSSGGSSSSTSSSSLKPGKTVVKVKSGAKWYNGVAISDFVFDQNWIVYSVSGTKVIINKDTTGTYAIMSPIHINNLTVVK